MDTPLVRISKMSSNLRRPNAEGNNVSELESDKSWQQYLMCQLRVHTCLVDTH